MKQGVGGGEEGGGLDGWVLNHPLDSAQHEPCHGKT